MADRQPYIVIGGVEWVGLPEFPMTPIRTRIDTGAHTSSLHAEDLEVVPGGDAERVRFRVPSRMRNARTWWDCEATVVAWRTVRCSNGEAERRPVIKTDLVVGAERWRISLNLTSRERMKYRMLLGRSAMKDRVLVNPGHAFLHGRPKP